MQTVAVLSPSGSDYNKDINLAWLFSGLNRKMMAPVDGKGNAQNFIVNIKAMSGTDQAMQLSTASPTYITKQAVKNWYRVWRDSYREAGISLKDLGPYGRVFKPRFQNLAYGSSDHLAAVSTRPGEWTYSNIVTTPPVAATDSTAVQGQHLVDAYRVHLCGGHTSESTSPTRQFTSVGMLRSWLDSRKSSIGQDSDDVPESLKITQDNPLVLARKDSIVAEELLDEARDLQAEEAPYSDSTLSDLQLQADIRVGPDLTGQSTVQAPCGWINIAGASASYKLEIELVGITDL